MTNKEKRITLEDWFIPHHGKKVQRGLEGLAGV